MKGNRKLRAAGALGLACLFSLPAGVPAGESLIGLFTDESADVCGADAPAYITRSVYVIAVLDNSISGVTAAEFRIDKLPAAGGGLMTSQWESSLTLGDMANGIAMAFTSPQTGSEILLGRVDFMPFGDGWLVDDHRLLVKESLDSGSLTLVDEDFEEQTARGGRFTFNCSSTEACACGIGSAETATWGEVKSLY